MAVNAAHLDDRYKLNSDKAERFGYLLLAGLAVELVTAMFLTTVPGTEWWGRVCADVMIVSGVWGEIHFGRKAREAGDAAQTEATARIEEAKANVSEAALEIARLKRPREIDFEAFIKCPVSSPPTKVEIVGTGEADTDYIKLMIWAACHNREWNVGAYPPPSGPSLLASHLMASRVGLPYGVNVFGIASNDEAEQAIRLGVAAALSAGLKEGIPSFGALGIPLGSVIILVRPRP